MIWLVGDKGMLGTELAGLLAASGLEFEGSDREVDILDPRALALFAAGKKIDWIVNCAAYTAVDRAEDEAEFCSKLNAGGPENLAGLARSVGARILYISTDYVFDGSGSMPRLEDDPVSPIGVYGRTKAEGEARLRAACSEHVIVRTAWLYGKHGPNFVYTMLKAMAAKDRIGVVADQRGTPTCAKDLAGAIVKILRSPHPEFGTFHFTDSGETSWYDFAVEIQRLGRESGILERDCSIDALTTAQYPTKAKRPAYSVLSKEKIKAAYGLKIPAWEDSLAAFIKEIAAIKRRQAAWNAHADYDIGTAEIDAANRRFRPALFWCMQAVEKVLKGNIEFYDRPKHVHELLKLSSFLRLTPDPSQRRLMSDLEQWYVNARYSADIEHVDWDLSSEYVHDTIRATKELLTWIRAHNRFPIG